MREIRNSIEKIAHILEASCTTVKFKFTNILTFKLWNILRLQIFNDCASVNDWKHGNYFLLHDSIGASNLIVTTFNTSGFSIVCFLLVLNGSTIKLLSFKNINFNEIITFFAGQTLKGGKKYFQIFTKKWIKVYDIFYFEIIKFEVVLLWMLKYKIVQFFKVLSINS